MTGDHLNRQAELALFERYRHTHDRGIEEALVRSQMGLVHKLACSHAADRVEREDLIQEGLLGLLKGIRCFDSTRGVRLSTYAAWWIRAYQSKHIIKNHRLVRLGTTQVQRRLFSGLRRLRARLVSMGVEPTEERIGEQLGANADEVREMAVRLDLREASLDAPAYDDSPDSMGARLPATGVLPDELAMAHEAELIVQTERERFYAGLEGRRREIFDARWLHDEAPTLQALGDRYGLTRERVRQIERSMLNQLRRRLEPRLALAQPE